MEHDIEVTFSSGNLTDKGDIEIVLNLDGLDDMEDALDVASDISNWEGVGFVTIWDNGDVAEQFFSQTEAHEAYLRATGRA